MLLELETFTIETALDAATELRKVLAARTHRRKVMGQEVMVPGQLGEALQLPRIINRLQSKQMKQRELGLEDFQELWPTLSPQTRERVLEQGKREKQERTRRKDKEKKDDGRQMRKKGNRRNDKGQKRG